MTEVERLRALLAEWQDQAATLAGQLALADEDRGRMAARLSVLETERAVLAERLEAVSADLTVARAIVAAWERNARGS